MAAKQAAALCKDAKVHVIESRNLGDGYAALCAADLESPDAETLEKDLTDAMAGVRTGYISPSIRDAELNGVHIENGDYIGFEGKTSGGRKG